MNSENGFILIVAGATCVGKTTLEKKMISDGFTPINITTNREKRKDDPDYYSFSNSIDPDDFDFFLKTKDGDFYGYKLPKESNKIVVSFISYDSASIFRDKIDKLYPDIHNIIIGLTASKEEQESCIKKRGLSKDKIEIRKNSIGDTDKADLILDREYAYDTISAFVKISEILNEPSKIDKLMSGL